MSPTLDQLLHAVEQLDTDGKLKGQAYAKTYNESIGLASNDDSNFMVFAPWGKWPPGDDYPSKFPSAVANAFKAVIDTGCADMSADNKYCYIDIAHLNDDSTERLPLFHDKGDSGTSIAQTLRKAIKTCEENKKTPIVRFLVGLPPPSDSIDPNWWDKNKKAYEAIFWPEGGSPLTSDPEAEFHVGIYSPDVAIGKDASVHVATASENESWLEKELREWLEELIDELKQKVNEVVGELVELVQEAIEAVLDTLETLKQDLVIWILGIVNQYSLPSISWNHAKVVAVNSKSLLVGGENFWKDYGSDVSGPVDMSMTIRGDATVACHNFMDNFWDYLNSEPEWDQVSIKRSTKLSGSKADWKENMAVRLFGQKPQKDTGIPVLSVGKVGNFSWALPFGAGEEKYPSQIADALRDFLLNISDVIISAKCPDLLYLVPWLVSTLGDGTDLAANKTLFKKLNINPASWSSRYARTVAIEQAEKGVQMSAQMIANALTIENKGYTDFIVWMLEQLGIPKEDWQGRLWPYDLLVAFAKLLSRVAKSGDSHAAVHVILPKFYDLNATHHNPKDDNGDYQDATSVTRLKNKLSAIMKAMARAKQLPVDTDPDDVDGIMDKHFVVKRLDLRDSTGSPLIYGVHTKVVCVDKSLLYIGSDNPYVSYNDEYGVWIDSQKHIQAWQEDYWKQAWARATVKDE